MYVSYFKSYSFCSHPRLSIYVILCVWNVYLMFSSLHTRLNISASWLSEQMNALKSCGVIHTSTALPHLLSLTWMYIPVYMHAVEGEGMVRDGSRRRGRLVTNHIHSPLKIIWCHHQQKRHSIKQTRFNKIIMEEMLCTYRWGRWVSCGNHVIVGSTRGAAEEDILQTPSACIFTHRCKYLCGSYKIEYWYTANISK